MAEEEKLLEEKIFDIAPGESYEDNRSRLAIFFQVLGRKFWKLIGINLMYLLFNIPAIIASFFLSTYIVELFFPVGSDAVELVTTLFVYGFPVLMYMMAVPVISVGPAQAGLTYLLRCFSYEQPTFNWSDFKDKMKENLKQGIAVTLINLVLTVFLIVDFYLYSQIRSNASLLFSVANGLLIMVFLLFLMMNLYIYPMMVTYELSLKNLYKNAFLFAFARLLHNFAVLLICFILVMAPMIVVMFTGSYLALIIGYVYYAILGFTLPGLIINFFINPVIDKYLRPNQ